MSPRHPVPALVALGVIGMLLVTLGPVASDPAGHHGSTAAQIAPSGRAGLPSTNWPTYMYDVERTGANHADRTLGIGTVASLVPLWSVASNGSDFSAPIEVNGTVYFGSWNGTEYAVNATSGAVEWSRYLGTDTACGGGYTPMGISSTPAYSNGTLYLGGGDGFWYALNAANGSVEWRTLVGGNETDGYYAWASALAYRQALYIGTASCFDSPLVAAALVEVNLSGTHAIEHAFNTTPAGQVGVSIWTTPALDPANNTLWLATGNENPPGYPIYANAIVGLNATTLNVSGSWQVPNVAGQDSDFGSTPTLFSTANGTPMVVATNKNGVAFALNRSNVTRSGSWAPSWNLSTGGGFSGGAFDGTTLYLAGGSTVYAVDPGNGTVVWTAPMDGGGAIYGSLAWANGLVYAGGGGEVEAIDAANGTVLWNATLAGGLQTVTEPVVAAGRLFVAAGGYAGFGNLTAYGLPIESPRTLWINETGLPNGTRWSATVGSATVSTLRSSAEFNETPGLYPFSIGSVPGYAATPSAGTVTIGAANVTQPIHFAPAPGGGSGLRLFGLSSDETYLLIGGIAGGLALAGTVIAVRRRRSSPDRDAPPPPDPPTPL